MFLSLITIFLGLGLMAVAIGFLYSGVNQYLVQGSRMARRLRFDGSNRGASVEEEKLVPDEGVLESVEKLLTPQDEERASAIRRKLRLAGYRNPSAVRVYFACKWGIAIFGLVISSLAFATMMSRADSLLLPLAGTFVVVLLSFFATDMWVERNIAYRRIDIEKAFPDALDLLLVCIEAGHGLDQAIYRVANELRHSAPVLAEELSMIVAELRAGKDRSSVLRDFAERSNVTDVSAFVTVIKQADQFGVSIADTLRVYSKEMRNKRYMRAEEKANMMPIKLALGAIMFTIPPVILILIGPSVILIIREMAKAAGTF